MNILMLTTVLPHKLKTGGEIASMNYIDAIESSGHKLDVLGYLRVGDDQPSESRYISGGSWYIEMATAGYRSILWMLRSLLFGQPFVVAKFFSRSYLKKMKWLFNKKKYDVVIIDHTQMAWVLPWLPARVPKIFVAHNVESQLYLDQSRHLNWRGVLKRFFLRRDSKLLEKLERVLVSTCNQVWVLTENDRSFFTEISCRKKVKLFELPGKVLGKIKNSDDFTCDVGLIGTWLWDVNKKGLEWFLLKIAPLIPGKYSINVAGRCDGVNVEKHQNVKFLGFVDDATEFMQSCRVLIVPSVSGAGVQIKTIEAISSGVPVIATKIAMRGIETKPDSVRVVNDPVGIIEQLLDVLNNPAKSDANAGYNWAQKRAAQFSDSVMSALKSL